MARLRMEFLTVGEARGALGGQIDVGEGRLLAGSSLDVTDIPTAPVEVPGATGSIFVALSATGGPVYVALGTFPDPLVEPRCLVAPGRPRLLHVTRGQSLASVAAADALDAHIVGAISSASPLLAAGDHGALSLNMRGAVRVIRQKADGSDVDETAPRETVPGKSGTVTVAQVLVGNGPPTTPALASNTGRKHARLVYKAGGASLYWAPTPGTATSTLGCLVPAGAVFDLPPGYTGDVYLVGDAAGPTAVSLSQLA